MINGNLRQGVIKAVTVAGLFASASHLNANEQYQYVPDDTLLFLGTSKPMQLADLRKRLGDTAELDSGEGPELTLWQEFLPDSVLDGEGLVNELLKNPIEWGVNEDLLFSVYSIGLLPVFRVAADKTTFEAAISRYHDQNNQDLEKLTHKDIEVWVAKLVDSDQLHVEAGDNETNVGAFASSDPTSVVERAKQKYSDLDQSIADAEAAIESIRLELEANNSSNKPRIGNSALKAYVREKELEIEKMSVQLRQWKQYEVTRAESRARRIVSGQPEKIMFEPSLVITYHDSDLVVAISHDPKNSQLLDKITGIEKPLKSIATTGKVKQFRQHWQYDEGIAGYMDFEAIARVITGQGDFASEQLQLVSRDHDTTSLLFNMVLANDPCKREIQAIGAAWPELVFGFTLGEGLIDFNLHTALASAHDGVQSLLSNLNGYIPKPSRSAVATFGIGLEVNKIPKITYQYRKLVSQFDFECLVLDKLNDIGAGDGSLSSSMGLMMMTGLAKGLQGFAVNIFDIGKSMSVRDELGRSADVMVQISAEDIEQFVQSMRMFPEIGPLLNDLALDGTELKISDQWPKPLPGDPDVYIRVEENTLIFAAGAQARQFSSETQGHLERGSLRYRFNFENGEELINNFFQDLDTDKLDKVMKFFGYAGYELDFTERGIEMQMRMRVHEQQD